jgi:glycosyltransferase involved in cell wall biosynthesis
LGRIRVLRVIARLNIGGPAYHVAEVMRAMPADRYEQFLAAGALGAGEGSFEHMVGAVTRVPGLRPEVRPLHDLRALASLVALVRRLRPDIVETHTAKAGTLGRLAVALAGRPRPAVIHIYHGHVLSGYFGPLATRAYRRVERLLARRTDRIVSVSCATRDDLLSFGVGRPEQHRVIPLGLDLGRFATPDPLAVARVRAELGGAGGLLALYVGRLVPIKRVDLLLEAVAAAPRIRLAIVGDGPQRGSLEEQARRLGIADRVCFTGFRHDTELIVAAADVAVLASDNEGTPVSLIEAAAAGRGAVATAVGGVPETVGADAALLVGAGNSGALAAALTRLAEDPKLCVRLGEAARRRSGRWGVPRLVDDLERLYAEVLEERHAP